MPQLHLYVAEDVAAALKARARARRMSLSRYLAQLATAEAGQGWPRGFFNQVVGGWKGAPLKRASQGRLERRDRLD